MKMMTTGSDGPVDAIPAACGTSQTSSSRISEDARLEEGL